ncbi:MAG: tetratricopeptide repeat protein, partial [Candidatus Melainabacteria bacterium]|nr:tetratricopeptide repeat protein [Candidatus Melainabacteria bacterium]
DEGDPETVKLIDFGMPPDPVQNAYYLSPEQCLDRNRANERSDVYSLGCIMYESLVGTPPFIGDQVSQASTNYLHELANHYDKTAPEHNALKLLDCIIVKCLQKKPAKRFRNVRELMDALRLVNDCIVDGSQRKLPRKAEKLLLFRFLDFFDKKILTCMSAYLILGLVSVAYIGELQLQKHIDEAQLAGGALNTLVATSNWKAALKQAQLSNKPPSLQADLQWELADSLRREFDEAKNPVSRNAIADETRKHYEEAYNYFSHGAHYRSYALTLLHNISSMYMATEDPDLVIERKAAAVKQLKTLFQQKKYTQCARAAKEYLTKFDDEEVAYYAGCSNNEIGTTLPSKDALRFFERSEYYFQQAGKKDPNSQNRTTCLHELGFDANQPGTALAMACRALEDGDMEAAEAEFRRDTSEPDAYQFMNGLVDYRNSIVEINRRAMTSIDTKNAIKPLELALEIEQKAYGMNHLGLGQTLSDLARCYRNSGETQKALNTYKRLFTIVPREDQATADVLTYVDLLSSTGHKTEARKELEKRALNDAGFYNEGALYVRLIQAYGTDKMKDKAHKLINKYVTDPKPVKLVTYEQYYGHASSPNDPF